MNLRVLEALERHRKSHLFELVGYVTANHGWEEEGRQVYPVDKSIRVFSDNSPITLFGQYNYTQYFLF